MALSMVNCPALRREGLDRKIKKWILNELNVKSNIDITEVFTHLENEILKDKLK